MSGRTTSVHATPAAEAIAELGESPLWDGDHGLRWLDVEGRRMFTLGLDGRTTSVALTCTVTAIELTEGEDLLAVTSQGFGSLDTTSGRVDQVLTVLSDDRVSMNDGAIDPQGRCWAGSATREETKKGALFRLDRDKVTTQVSRIGMSNGLGWSPSGDRMYHVDTAAGTITARRYDVRSGDIGEPQVLRTVESEVGLLDGLTVDTDGAIWLAVWGAGQVWRLDPHAGDTTGVVALPTPYPTSCEFGGSDLSRLYITTANYRTPPGGGLLYAADVPARGQKPRRFRGTVK